MRTSVPFPGSCARGMQAVSDPPYLQEAILPPYELPPEWVPPQQRRNHPDYDNDLIEYLPRTAKLIRSKASDQLGFNVRGGTEYNCGIFISKVLPNSNAQRLGLREGDQILRVNEVDFEDIDHGEAVRQLKLNPIVEMIIRFFPYGYERTYEKTKVLSNQQQQQQLQQHGYHQYSP